MSAASRAGRGRRLSWPVLLVALACLEPFVSFYAGNLSEGLRPRDLALPAVAAAAFGVGLYLVLRLVSGADPARLSSAVVVAAILFFEYGRIARPLLEAGLAAPARLAVWGGLAAVGVGAGWWLGRYDAFRHGLALFVGLRLLVSLGSVLALGGGGDAGPSAGGERAEVAFWSGELVRRPNVYWIVLDGFPNRAALRENYGVDLPELERELESRGFYVARDSYANFNDTALSMASALEMDYVFEQGETFLHVRGNARIADPGRTGSSVERAVSGDNRSVRLLRDAGYAYVHLANGWNITRCRGFETLCLGGRLSELDVALLSLTPLPSLRAQLRRLAWGSSVSGVRPSGGRRSELPQLLAALPEIRRHAPFFLYAHLHGAHGPFVSNADCGPRARALRYPEDFDGPGPALDEAFLEQLRCVSRQIPAFLDSLLAADPESILVLSGDHGPRLSRPLTLPLAQLRPEDVREHLGILNALRLPSACRDGLHPGLTPVDTMRLVLACLGGQPPRLLEARHFVVSRWPDNPDFGRIRRVDPREGAPGGGPRKF